MSQLITDPRRVARMFGTLQSNVSIEEIPDSTAEWIFQHPKEAGEQFTLFLKNGAKVGPILIDCDVPVFCPDKWKVLPPAEQIPSRVQGTFVWNPAEVKLHLSKKQKGSSYIVGNDLRTELVEGKIAVYTAHLLDYLLVPENQYLIPEEWKGKAIFFWGTIYRNSGGDLYVRYLYWGGNRWHWRYCWLDHNFDSTDPSASRA